MSSRKRFYRDVTVQREESGYAVLLDGKPIRTPAGANLHLPNAGLAEGVAAEWRTQGDKIRPETLILTKLANTAIDRVAANRSAAVEQILAFARSDLVCYRAEGPAELVDRQASAWDPLIDWVRETYGARLQTRAGIAFIEQPADALDALKRTIGERDIFTLAALLSTAALTGSAVIALTLADGRLSADEAFAAAQLDETYQAEKWGLDHEAERRSRSKAAELAAIARFIQLVKSQQG